MTLLKKTVEKLEEYSERIGVPVESLVQMLEPIASAYKKTFPKAKAAKIEGEALSRLRINLQGEHGKLTSPALNNIGYIAGDSGEYDWIEIMIRAAEKRYNDDPDGAKSQGYVDDFGTPIARRDRKFGKGVKRGEVLEGEEPQRDIYAFASWNDKPERFVKIQFKDHLAKELKIEPLKAVGKKCEWRSNIGELSTVTQQNTSDASKTHFRELDSEALDYDEIKEKFKKTLGLLEILDIEREYRRTPSDDRPKMVIAFECRVARVVAPDPESDMDNYIVTVTDAGLDFDLEERGMTIYVPDFWYTGWDQNAKLIVLGRPRVRKFMDEDTIAVDAFGVHVDPFSLVELPEPEKGAEPAPSGWVPKEAAEGEA